MTAWASGLRLAACGRRNTLAIAAYVLAGELARAKGDYKVAFAAYQERLMPFLSRKQEAAKKFASTFAPRSSLGIAARNLVMRLLVIPIVADRLVGHDLRDDVELPDYDWR